MGHVAGQHRCHALGAAERWEGRAAAFVSSLSWRQLNATRTRDAAQKRDAQPFGGSTRAPLSQQGSGVTGQFGSQQPCASGQVSQVLSAVSCQLSHQPTGCSPGKRSEQSFQYPQLQISSTPLVEPHTTWPG